MTDVTETKGASSLGSILASHKPGEPTRYGRIFKPDDAWLAKAPQEPVLEPELAIVDTHHHLWDFPGYRYLLDELLIDIIPTDRTHDSSAHRRLVMDAILCGVASRSVQALQQASTMAS